MTGIGGFFATLKIQYDQSSSDKSKKEIKELGEQAKKTGAEFDKFVGNAIKGIIALGTAAAGSAYAVSNIQGKMALTAKSAGMSYTELNKWSSALKLIGLDSSGVAAKMTSVNEAISDYKIGFNTEAYESLAKDLALMGISATKFAEMSPTERIMAVAGKAEAARGTDKERAYLDLADKLLGIGDLLMKETMAGTKYPTTASLFAAGSAGAWSSNAANITKNSEAFNALTNQMDQMWKSFGETMGTSFRPIIEDLTKFINDHKAEITAFFSNLGTLLADIVTLIGPTVAKLAEITGSLVGTTATGINTLKEGEANPERAARIRSSIAATMKSHPGSFAQNPLEAWFPKEGDRKAIASEVELMATNIEKGAGKYASALSSSARSQFAGSASAQSVTIGDINLSGVDFNQFVNYMQANPGANKYSVAAAALAATNTIAGTK